MICVYWCEGAHFHYIDNNDILPLPIGKRKAAVSAQILFRFFYAIYKINDLHQHSGLICWGGCNQVPSLIFVLNMSVGPTLEGDVFGHLLFDRVAAYRVGPHLN